MPIGEGGTIRQLTRQHIDCRATGYASTATATNASTWTSWNGPFSSTSITATTNSTAASSTWTAWNGGCVVSSYSPSGSTYTLTETWGGWNRDYQAMAESKAQRAARLKADQIELERERLVQRARATEQAEVRRVAILKADKLLESVLTSVQRDQLQKIGGFVLRGQSGQLYRIRYGRSANVDVLDAQGNVVDRLCAHPILNVPDQDTMVAQKVMLECDEAAFLRLANRHGPLFGQRVPAEALA